MGNFPDHLPSGGKPVEALAATLQTLQAISGELLDILPIAVCSCDLAGRIETYNRRAAELWGCEPARCDAARLSCGSFRMFTVDGAPMAHEQTPMAQVLRSGAPVLDREIVIERPDGSRRTVIANLIPRRDEHGNLTGAINCLTDITERKLADEEARASRAMFQSLFESAPDAIVVTVAGGDTIWRCNHRAEAMFGYGAGELPGQRVEILMPERFREEHRRLHVDYLTRPRPRAMGTGLDLLGQRKDGSEFPVDITLGALDTEQGQIALAIIRDVSERKAVDAERQARQAAEAANRAKSEFLANMSHELRSPLNTILGFARLMANDPKLAAAAGDDLQLILKSGEHLYALVNQVLDLSKLEAGHASFNAADFDLMLLLDDLRRLLKPAAALKGLRLWFAPRPEVPRQIRSDPLKLRQVLINLIENAIKFTHSGRVGVSVELSAAAEGGRGRLRFTVADTGPGIPANELSTLFDPFVQAEAGRQARYTTNLGSNPGTGLGLAINRGFVRLMGGEMEIASELGKGTTVSFDIPVGVVALPAMPQAAPFRRVLGLAHDQPRYRLLVVDDHAEARELLVRLLGPLGFALREAADGQQAIEAWRQWHPHLIWMDLSMPMIDGFAASRRIRMAADGARPVIIAVTAGISKEAREAALAAGCDDVLRKPVREAEIFSALEKHLAVQFIYEEALPAAPLPLDADALARLPKSERGALEDALIRLDSDAIERTIDAIREHDAQTARALAVCAADYQYDSILAALNARPAGERDAALPGIDSE